jgi:enamine deaminase RidA (YjgF/YER057c/UK114 family)
MTIDERVRELGLVLPEPFRSPTGAAYPFSWVRVRGNRAYISGHLPLEQRWPSRAAKSGKHYRSSKGQPRRDWPALAMLGSLQRELGELERITAWLRALGMVNVSPGTTQVAAVVNGFSALILEVFGNERGAHSRSAVGMAELPFGVAVEIEAEVEIE